MADVQKKATRESYGETLKEFIFALALQHRGNL